MLIFSDVKNFSISILKCLYFSWLKAYLYDNKPVTSQSQKWAFKIKKKSDICDKIIPEVVNL